MTRCFKLPAHVISHCCYVQTDRDTSLDFSTLNTQRGNPQLPFTTPSTQSIRLKSSVSALLLRHKFHVLLISSTISSVRASRIHHLAYCFPHIVPNLLLRELPRRSEPEVIRYNSTQRLILIPVIIELVEEVLSPRTPLGLPLLGNRNTRSSFNSVLQSTKPTHTVYPVLFVPVSGYANKDLAGGSIPAELNESVP
jgi:hypothetical protein